MTTYRESIKPKTKMKSEIKTTQKVECPSCGNIIITTEKKPTCSCGRKKDFRLISKKTEEVFSYD